MMTMTTILMMIPMTTGRSGEEDGRKQERNGWTLRDHESGERNAGQSTCRTSGGVVRGAGKDPRGACARLPAAEKNEREKEAKQKDLCRSVFSPSSSFRTQEEQAELHAAPLAEFPADHLPAEMKKCKAFSLKYIAYAECPKGHLAYDVFHCVEYDVCF